MLASSPHHWIYLYLCRRSYTEVLKDFFEGKLLCSQKLLSKEERYEKILDMIPDECKQIDFIHITLFPFFPNCFCNLSSVVNNRNVMVSAIPSELRGKWQDNKRSSMAKEDINIFRWEQLKNLLQSGKQKVIPPFKKRSIREPQICGFYIIFLQHML